MTIRLTYGVGKSVLSETWVNISKSRLSLLKRRQLYNCHGYELFFHFVVISMIAAVNVTQLYNGRPSVEESQQAAVYISGDAGQNNAVTRLE